MAFSRFTNAEIVVNNIKIYRKDVNESEKVELIPKSLTN